LRDATLTEAELRELVGSHGFSLANFSYRLDGPDRVRRHSMVLRSADRASAARLAATLEKTAAVLEFRITPTGD
jgi:putative Mg2+ transporter-C (MgtC) family protein